MLFRRSTQRSDDREIGGMVRVSTAKLVNRRLEVQSLLKMPVAEAEALFQSHPTERQLELIRATPHPKEREKLYYLVPDCTELMQRSPTEQVLQVLNTMLGTGLVSVLLPCLSAEQFEEVIDLSVWRNGALNKREVDLWLFELSNCDPDEISNLLTHIDVAILAVLLQDRIELKTDFAALMIESGVVDPSSAEIEYADERAREIMDTIWVVDEHLFTRVLYELFAVDTYDSVDDELSATLSRAKDERDQRVRSRDQAAGIETTEEDILQKVDLEHLDLDEGVDVSENGDSGEDK